MFHLYYVERSFRKIYQCQQVGLKTSRWPAPLICWYWPAFLSPGPFPLLQVNIITNQIDNSLCTFILYNIQCILYIVYCAWSFVAVENTCPEMGQTAGLRPKVCPPQSPLTNLPHPSHQVYFQFCQGYKAHNVCHTCIPKSWLSCFPSPQDLIWHLPTRTHSNHPPLGYRYLWFFPLCNYQENLLLNCVSRTQCVTSEAIPGGKSSLLTGPRKIHNRLR